MQLYHLFSNEHFVPDSTTTKQSDCETKRPLCDPPDVITKENEKMCKYWKASCEDQYFLEKPKNAAKIVKKIIECEYEPNCSKYLEILLVIPVIMIVVYILQKMHKNKQNNESP